MYKRASYRTDRDNPDPNELRDAAGIDPEGTPEFVRKVKFAVQRGRKETKNSSQLVGYLNSRGILNARGYRWTHAALDVFIRYYLKPARPRSK